MMQLLQTLVAIGALAGALYLLWRPQWVFVMVIAMFPLEQLLQVYVPAFGGRGTLFNYLVGGMAVAAVALRVMRRDSILLGAKNALLIVVVLIYTLWVAGIFYTPAHEVAVNGAIIGYPYIILLVVFLPLLVLDIFEFRKLITGLMLIGSAIAVLIITNPNSSYYSGRLYLDLGMLDTADRQTGNPLALGELGGMLALSAALIKPVKASQLFTLLRISAFVCGFGLAIGSGSRGQVLAAAIAGILFYPMARKIANPKQFFVSVAGFAVLILGLYIVFKMFIGAQNEQRWNAFAMLRDTTQRMDMVMALLGAYLASPQNWLFGLGTNAFASIGHNKDVLYVHNVVAEMLCEHGLVGAALFAFAVTITAKYGRRLWSQYRDDPSMRATVALLLAICTYALFLALKQGSISYPAPFFWWLVLAKLAKHEEHLMLAAAPEDAELEGHGDGVVEAPVSAGPADRHGPQDEGRDYALGY